MPLERQPLAVRQRRALAAARGVVAFARPGRVQQAPLLPAPASLAAVAGGGRRRRSRLENRAVGAEGCRDRGRIDERLIFFTFSRFQFQLLWLRLCLSS